MKVLFFLIVTFISLFSLGCANSRTHVVMSGQTAAYERDVMRESYDVARAECRIEFVR